MGVVLHGYKYSVYTWIVRACLNELGTEYTYCEVDPFAEHPDTAYQALNPFGNVPTLNHDGFVVFETSAITRYLSDQFNGNTLVPTEAKSLARCNQVIAITDNYGYWPLVRQVFSQRVFASIEGEKPDEDEISAGLKKCEITLAALEQIATEKLQLSGECLSLADLHLFPMISYFCSASEGEKMLGNFPELMAWRRTMRARPCFEATKPALPI